MNQYRPGGFNLLPPVVKNLLIINGLFFLATISFASAFRIDLTGQLGLFLPGSPFFKPYQLVTHMFMHANFSHIFFNMFALWMFGTAIENLMGGRRFLIYYLITGFGAALLHLGVVYIEVLVLKNQLVDLGVSAAEIRHFIQTGRLASPSGITVDTANKIRELISLLQLKYIVPSIGASGAVFGILLAFGMFFPNSYIYLFFAIPVKAKYFVIAYGVLELYFGIANRPGDNIAHFAHLGGMLFGLLLILFWRRRGEIFY